MRRRRRRRSSPTDRLPPPQYDSGESTYTPGGYQISEYKSVYDQR